MESLFLPAGTLLSVRSMPFGVSEFAYESGVGISRREGKRCVGLVGLGGSLAADAEKDCVEMRLSSYANVEEDGVPTAVRDD